MTEHESQGHAYVVSHEESINILGQISMEHGADEVMMQHAGEIVGVTGGLGTIGAHGTRAAGHEVADDVVRQIAQEVADGVYDMEVSYEHGPCSSGGTFSMVVADALTGRYLYHPGMDAAEHAKAVYGFLKDAIAQNSDLKKIIPSVCIDGRSPAEGSLLNDTGIGGHGDEHAQGENCGCGAEDKFADTPATEEKAAQMGSLHYMAEHGDTVRDDLAVLGIQVDDETHDLIVQNAKELFANGYAASGKALSDAMIAVAGAASVPTLAGEHFEILAKIGTNKERTLNRDALKARYGADCQAFEVDAGVFPEAAAVVAPTARGAEQFATAMAYFNAAVAKVLTDKDLPLAKS